MSYIPKIFQTLTLQEISYNIRDETLTIQLKLEKSVTEIGSQNSRIKTVNLGPFMITAYFTEENGDLYVRTVYGGELPVAYGGIAAEVYERIVVAFRSSVREAWDRVKPKVTSAFDFTELVKLVALTGLIVTTVKCPYCGGSINLPDSGDTTKCPYCGSIIKAVDLYKLLKDLLKGLA